MNRIDVVAIPPFAVSNDLLHVPSSIGSFQYLFMVKLAVLARLKILIEFLLGRLFGNKFINLQLRINRFFYLINIQL
jgi:hypothetical protein